MDLASEHDDVIFYAGLHKGKTLKWLLAHNGKPYLQMCTENYYLTKTSTPITTFGIPGETLHSFLEDHEVTHFFKGTLFAYGNSLLPVVSEMKENNTPMLDAMVNSLKTNEYLAGLNTTFYIPLLDIMKIKMSPNNFVAAIEVNNKVNIFDVEYDIDVPRIIDYFHEGEPSRLDILAHQCGGVEKNVMLIMKLWQWHINEDKMYCANYFIIPESKSAL